LCIFILEGRRVLERRPLCEIFIKRIFNGQHPNQVSFFFKFLLVATAAPDQLKHFFNFCGEDLLDFLRFFLALFCLSALRVILVFLKKRRYLFIAVQKFPFGYEFLCQCFLVLLEFFQGVIDSVYLLLGLGFQLR
jgi:hypothetical protein